jgi:hypothetical protein
MKRGNSDTTRQRGAKGARGAAGTVGRRGRIGKPGQRGVKGPPGTVHNAEILDKFVRNFENIYQLLTAQSKRIADMQHQLDEFGAQLKARR